MENYNKIFGTLIFDGRQCQFILDNHNLHIDVSDSILIKGLMSQKHPPLRFNSLYGKIATEPKHIFFSFEPNLYDTNLQFGELVTARITIHINYYLVLNKVFSGNSLSIEFNNDSFLKWLGVYPKYTFDTDNLEDIKIALKKDTIDCKSDFEYQGNKYTASPSYRFTNSIVEYRFSSFLEITCHNRMTFDSIHQLCKLILTLARFFFYRFYVDLGDIVIKQNTIVQGGTHKTEVGRFFFKYERKEIEPIKMTYIFDYGFFKWIDIYRYLGNLVNLIENESIYLFNLPEKRFDRFKTDYPSVSSISAAFEREFSLLYPNFKSPKIEDNDYIDLKAKLSNMEKTKKQKEIVQNFIKNNLETASLLERATYALNEFKDILDSFKTEKELNSQKIATCFKVTRNKIDHGDLSFRIDGDIAATFYYFRIVILCIQLTRIGVPRDELINTIKPVLSLDYNR